MFPSKPQPRPTNKTLCKKLTTRLKEAEFRDTWIAAMTRASKSTWCNEGGWFTLDWFLKNDDNWRKCLDGNYDDKGAMAPIGKFKVGR